MELKQKKEHVLRCIKLGMDIYKAYIVAECTEEEVDLLNNDDKFQNIIIQRQALQEYDLLLKHNVAMDLAEKKGNAKPIEWRLKILNPEKYDKKDKIVKLETPEAITVNLKGVDVDSD